MAPHPASAIDLRLLRQFVAVAEELHFRRAARRLAMSQPPLTAAIQRLEAEIGATLLERGNRAVALTPAGATLLEEARALLRQADHAVLAARDAAAGRLGIVRLGYVGSAMYGRLPATIRSLRRHHPGLRLELREATTAAQVAALHAAGDRPSGRASAEQPDRASARRPSRGALRALAGPRGPRLP